MTTPTGKKRGRPRKPLLILKLADVRQEWEPRLRRTGLPQIPAPPGIQESALPPTTRAPDGRKIRPTKVKFGESVDHKSATQLTDPLLSSYNEAAADESVVLPTTWLRYLKYMSIIAETLSRNDKGAGLRLMFVEDARSRRYEQPPHIPAELGTPAEFKERVAGHEFEIRKRFSRREHVLAIRVYSLPPDEDEDLDPADEPAGHWEGLKWLPDPAK